MPIDTGLMKEAAMIYIKSNALVVLRKRVPLFDMIFRNGANVNTSTRTGSGVKHQLGSLVRPTGNTVWQGRSAGWSNQIDVTSRPYYNAEPTFAEYLMTQLECPVGYSREQLKQWDDAKTDVDREKIVKQIGDEVLTVFGQEVDKMLHGSAPYGAGAASKSRLMSLNYAGNNANSVGGLNPGTYTLYQAIVRTAALSVNEVNVGAEIRYMREEAGAEPDFMLVSTNTSGPDILGRIEQWQSSKVMYVANAGAAPETFKVPKPRVIYAGCEVMGSNNLAANEVYIGQSDELFLDGDMEPDTTGRYTIPGTAAEGETLYAFMCFSIRNLRSLYRGTAWQL